MKNLKKTNAALIASSAEFDAAFAGTSVVEATVVETQPCTALAIVETVAPEGWEQIEGDTAEVQTPVERVELVRVTIHGARKPGKMTIIHSCLWGKERWFAMNRLHSWQKMADGTTQMVLPKTELSYRDSELTEPLAVVEPYDGKDNLMHPGGVWDKLNEGYAVAG